VACALSLLGPARVVRGRGSRHLLAADAVSCP
jgi:hypothetical protein